MDLSGCFRVSTNVMRSIALCPNLRRLNLTKCKHLTIEGIKDIAKGCRKIRNVSFSGCEECVTDAFVEHMATLKRLEIIELSGCSKIGKISLNALTKCTLLRKLNLSDCKNVCDDALNALSYGEFVFGLNELHLSGCIKVSSAGVSDIANGRSNGSGSSIVKLSLKSTK